MAVRHPEAVERFRQRVLTEWDAAALYRGLADLSRGRRREVLTELAAIEDKHADFWSAKIREYGAEPPTPVDFSPSRRTLVMLDKARRYSTDLVLPVVEQDERNAIDGYSDEPEAPASMIAEEAEHARALDELMRLGPEGDDDGPLSEPWHRSDKSGALRAGIFGINDGLVSNTSLVMGFAGAAAPRTTVLLAGLAGLLAGAFSMGAGEYISVTSQRELFEREIALEAEEIEAMPDEEANDLALIYRAKGVGREEAEAMAARIMRDRTTALDTMAREELGLNPDELGSPWGVATSSFVSFAVGAVVPVLPWLVASGVAAFAASVVLSVLALFLVGAGISLLTGRPLFQSGARQLLVGGLAAAATFGIGRLIGVSVS